MSYVPLPSANILFQDSVAVVSDSLLQINSKLSDTADRDCASSAIVVSLLSEDSFDAVCITSAAIVTIALSGSIAAARNTHILRVILVFFIFLHSSIKEYFR